MGNLFDNIGDIGIENIPLKFLNDLLTETPILVGVIIVATLSIVLLYLFVLQIVDFIKKVSENKLRRLKVFIFISFISVIFSCIYVINVKLNAAEKPIFLDKNGEKLNFNKLTFIAEMPIFSWEFDKDNTMNNILRNENKELFYQVEYKNLEYRTDEGKIDKGIAKIVNYQNYELEALPPEGEIEWYVTPGYMKNDNKFNPYRYSKSKKLTTVYYSNLYNKILQEKTFKVATSSSINRGYFKFIDKDGNETGFELELVKQLKNELFGNNPNISIKWVNESWENLMPFIGEKKLADIAINTISKTKNREDNYHIKFSRPYKSNVTQSLIVSKNSSISNLINNNVLDTLKGETVSVLNGSTAHQLVTVLNQILQNQCKDEQGNVNLEKYKNLEIKVEARKNARIITDDLYKNRSKYAITDTPYALAIKKNLDYRVKILEELTPELFEDTEAIPPELISQEYCIVINGEYPEFLNSINEAIKDLNNSNLISVIENMEENKYEQAIVNRS